MEEETGIGKALENETEKESTILRSRINRLLVATTRDGDENENENEIGSSTGMRIGRREREITEIGIVGSIGNENSGSASGGGEIGIIRANAIEEKESATVTASCLNRDNIANASASTPTRTRRRTLRAQGGILRRPLVHHAWHNRMWAVSVITFRCRKYTTTALFRPARQRRGGHMAVIGVLCPRRRRCKTSGIIRPARRADVRRSRRASRRMGGERVRGGVLSMVVGLLS